MNAVNDTIDVSRNLKNNSLSGMNLENSNSLALPTVQTTLMRQASNGCQVTMRFREKQNRTLTAAWRACSSQSFRGFMTRRENRHEKSNLFVQSIDQRTGR